MAMTTMNISIDDELKNTAQSFFEELGLDISTAIDMLLRKAIYQEQEELLLKVRPRRERSTPYLIKPDTSKTPVAGQLKGLIKIASDFDEPLEEMKEYMY